MGNQMFQYAFGKRIEHETDYEVKYDISWYDKAKTSEYRPIQLNHFNCQLNIATKSELNHFFPHTKWCEIFNKLKKQLFPYYKQNIIYEKHKYNFDCNLLKVKDNTYYAGFWQHELYFKSIQNNLKKEFVINSIMDSSNIKWNEKIKMNYNQSVCLHVRRGDYVGNTAFDLNGIEYYKAAIKKIYLLVKNPIFFIFSNDFDWVLKHFSGSNFLFVNVNNENTGYFDFELMNNCKHFIISNSSFSWWAAWLNNGEQQIKIAPKKWVNFASVKSIDIIPNDWNTI